MRRPTIRFVRVKPPEQQGRLMRQRTQLINAMRAHLAELGIVSAQGREGLSELLSVISYEQEIQMPIDACASLMILAAQL